MIQQACCELQQPAGHLAPTTPSSSGDVDTGDGQKINSHTQLSALLGTRCSDTFLLTMGRRRSQCGWAVHGGNLTRAVHNRDWSNIKSSSSLTVLHLMLEAVKLTIRFGSENHPSHSPWAELNYSDRNQLTAAVTGLNHRAEVNPQWGFVLSLTLESLTCEFALWENKLHLERNLVWSQLWDRDRWYRYGVSLQQQDHFTGLLTELYRPSCLWGTFDSPETLRVKRDSAFSLFVVVVASKTNLGDSW